MKALLYALAVSVLVGQATAEPRYDRKLEQAVMAIVAAKIGEIRGGFAFDDRPVMVIVRDDIIMATTDMDSGRLAPSEGMPRATGRRPAAPTTF